MDSETAVDKKLATADKKLKRLYSAIETIADAITPDDDNDMKLTDVVTEACRLIAIGRLAECPKKRPAAESSTPCMREACTEPSVAETTPSLSMALQDRLCNCALPRSGSLCTQFPTHVALNVGASFRGTHGNALTVVGWLSHHPTFNIVAVPTPLYDTPGLVFERDAFSTWRTDFVVKQVVGDVQELVRNRLASHAPRLSIPELAMEQPFSMMLCGAMRRVRVVDIHPRRKLAVVMQEEASTKHWYCSIQKFHAFYSPASTLH